jgi:rfaE bifunctional protein kinase chain/domain
MNRYDKLISSFPDATIGVIGDIVADIYVMGYPERLSREAPVMIVRHEEERLIPGCAANTMNNLLALGCKVIPVSMLGWDEHAVRLEQFFTDRVPMDGIYYSPDLRTVTKTRIMVGEPRRTKQQVIRIDCEEQKAAPPEAEARILEAIDRVDPLVDAWLVSDYGYFVITKAVAERLLALCRNKPLVVDSQRRSAWFKGAGCMTPNENEALELAGFDPGSDFDIESIGARLLDELDLKSLIITRGNQGMAVFKEEGGMAVVPPVGDEEVVDVSGAGDTVSAAVTASLVSGADTIEAARLASCAAGVVVMKTGAATCSPEELAQRIRLMENPSGA